MTDTPGGRGGQDTRIGAALLAFAADSGIDLRAVKSPNILLPIPPSMLPLLAQIALLWGFFERHFERMLVALLIANDQADTDWQRFSFEQKSKQLGKLAKALFAEHESLLTYVEEVLKDARTLQLERNLLLHGSLSINADPATRTFTIRAKGRKKGQTIEEVFTAESIRKLTYDLAHLAGRIAGFNPPWIEGSFPTLSSPDKSFLRNFLSSNHPDHTSRATPSGQPQS